MSPSRRLIPLGLVLAVCALLGAAAAVAALSALTGNGDATVANPPSSATPPATTPPTSPPTSPPTTGPATEPPPTPPSTEGPGTTLPVQPVACPSDVPVPVCEAADFVQRETGRSFRTFPAVELADSEAFQARLLRAAEEDLPEVEPYGRTLAALGLVDPEVDVVAALRDLYAVGTAGFYLPDEDVLMVRGAEFTPYTRIVVVHELVHALDDHYFDLDRPGSDELDSEAAFGFGALVEGHASVVEDRYRESLSRDEQRAAAIEELRMVFDADIDLSGLPPVLAEMLLAPYELGRPLVRDLLQSGGEAAVAEAFARPPATSEQVLHPGTNDPAVPVPTPPADGPVVEEDVLGEYGLGLVLGDEGAAEGWGGDRYVTWSDGDRSCTRVDVVFDSDADRAEARSAAESDEDRAVEELAVAGTTGLRITRCTP